ncbi:MAG TPA: hypothetical protein DCL75_05845 [Ktedonobacter sp.]|nr:hypothetical protein [Ktedonobacter sp.]
MAAIIHRAWFWGCSFTSEGENEKRDRSLFWGEHDRWTQIRGVGGKSWVQNTVRHEQPGWLNGAG